MGVLKSFWSSDEVHQTPFRTQIWDIGRWSTCERMKQKRLNVKCEKQSPTSGVTFSPVYKPIVESPNLNWVSDRFPSCKSWSYGKESVSLLYLLSDHIGIMTGFDFECTVICPKIHGICDTGYTTFVDL